MGPSASIMAVAAVQFLGSGTILVLWGRFLWEWVKFVHKYPVNHQVLDPSIWAAFVAVPIAFSLLGVVTSIGLLRLREWARRMTILLATIPVLGGAALAALHPPTLFPSGAPGGGAMLTVKSGIVLEVFLCILLLLAPISIWWLVVMTHKSVRSQFR